MAPEARRRPGLWELGGRKDGYCGREGGLGTTAAAGTVKGSEVRVFFFFEMRLADGRAEHPEGVGGGALRNFLSLQSVCGEGVTTLR